MTYETLLKIIENENIEYVETKFPDNLKGLCKGNKIGVSENLTIIEKACVISEELGHYYTSTGNIIDLSDVRNRKQELQARFWAYNKQVGLLGIVQAFEARCQNRSDMADYLNVTEEFLSEALEYYKHKYGVSVKVNNYIIQFIPNLQIIKTLKK